MTDLPIPREDERTMAMLTEIISVFAGFLGPLIILIIKRDSKFVSFYALQCLFWHLLYGFVFVIIFMVVFFGMFAQIATLPKHPNAPPPVGLFLGFPLIFLSFLGLWVINIALGIIFALKARSGEWARYPIVGRLALKLIVAQS